MLDFYEKDKNSVYYIGTLVTYKRGDNLFEVIDSFVLYLGQYDSDSFNTANRIATLTSNMIYITFILILTTFTIVKMKIETCIYY